MSLVSAKHDVPTVTATVRDDFAWHSTNFESTLAGWREQERTPATVEPRLSGLVAGRYEVRGVLGAGGMGAVYHVYDRLAKTDRALKLNTLPQNQINFGPLRLKQEFLAMSSLRHPNLPTVIDYGILDGERPFLVMELVAGAPIATDRPMELTHFYTVFVQFLRALSFIHERGFLHRDVKPANALLGDARILREPRLVLLDFGLMERIGTASEKRISGTPSYMAPEIIKGKPLDPRTDLYALGISAYQLLTSHLPFAHQRVEQLFQLHENARRPRVGARNHRIPAALDELIFRMMAAAPSDRPASAEDVLLELVPLTDQVHASDLAARRAYLHQTELVGRAVQMEQLAAGLRSVENGTGKAYLIAGATGAGKSRLLEEIQLDAMMSGFIVAGVTVREQFRTPFEALRVILRGLWPCASEWGELPTNTRALHRLLPEWSGQFASSDSRVNPQDERGYVMQETFDWIRQLSRKRPLLVLADDLQWCDESSLLVLRSLSHQLRHARVMFAGAFRANEIAPGTDIDQWQHSENISLIEIPGFSESEMAKFLDGLLGRHALGCDFVVRTQKLTEGNPFFTIELLRDLIDREILVRIGGLWNLTSSEFRLAENMAQLLQRRLSRLSDKAQRIALRLAIAGGRLTLRELKDLVDWEDPVLLNAVEETLRTKLALAAGNSVALVHDSVREVIYSTAQENDRRQLHQELAEYLELNVSPSDPDRSALLGHHFSRGLDVVKGLAFLETAGRAAFQQEQHGAAFDLLCEAERLLIDLPAVSNRNDRLYEVRKMLTIVCVSDNYEKGVECGEWVYQEAIRRGILRPLPWLQRFLPDPLPFLLILIGVLPGQLLLRGRKAWQRLQSDLNDIFRAVGYYGNCLASMSKLTSSTKAAEQMNAFVLSRNSLAVAVRNGAQTIARFHQLGPGPIARSFERDRNILLDEAITKLLDDYSRTMLIGASFYAQALTYAWEMHPDFESKYRTSVDYATQHNNQFLHHLNAHAKVEKGVYSGDVFVAEKGEAAFREALDRLGGKSRQREWLIDFAMGQLDIDSGQFDRATRRVRRLLRDGPGYFTEGFGFLLRARLNLHWNRSSAALDDANSALKWARDPEVKAPLFEFRVLGVIAHIHLLTHQPVRALQTLDQMLPFAQDNHPTPYFCNEVARYRALALSLTSPQKATTLAHEALERTALIDCPKQTAELHLTLGQIKTHSGGSAREIENHWATARGIFHRLGNGFQERAIAELEKAGMTARRM